MTRWKIVAVYVWESTIIIGSLYYIKQIIAMKGDIDEKKIKENHEHSAGNAYDNWYDTNDSDGFDAGSRPG